MADGKFETGFSGSHLTAEELLERILTARQNLRKDMPRNPGARFRYRLEVHEI